MKLSGWSTIAVVIRNTPPTAAQMKNYIKKPSVTPILFLELLVYTSREYRFSNALRLAIIKQQ